MKGYLVGKVSGTMMLAIMMSDVIDYVLFSHILPSL